LYGCEAQEFECTCVFDTAFGHILSARSSTTTKRVDSGKPEGTKPRVLASFAEERAQGEKDPRLPGRRRERKAYLQRQEVGMKSAMTVLILTVVVAGSMQTQAPDSVGEEFQVNCYTTDFQRRPAVAADLQGNFVVVWQSDGSYGTDTAS
jgi:hypothetical protein